MDRYICIHAHFYQPPRENPWLEEVELQDSAYPYHDWNERITAECYAPNTASRILNQGIFDIVNNYSRISFNFGPALLYWLERHKPEIYQGVLEADRLGEKRFSGHGSAIAQVYNHMIMPLANKRDKYTQVIWGIKDFQKRFGRFPEGMWLPETAVDIETLDVLAELGIKFTILAPRQAKRVREIGKGWKDVSGGRVDPRTAYLCRLPSGRSINLFFYNGAISHEVAFGELLENGEVFAKRLTGAFLDRECPQIVHIATDGETYGHHHFLGDMALAYCLNHIETENLAKITNYGEYLERHPPAYEAEILENSSWSCIHGVERWRDNCGCSLGTKPGWTQVWRRHLREAVDGVRDRLIPFFEAEASKYLRDPWDARNDYIEAILDRSLENVEGFLRKHAIKELSKEEIVRVLKLLEMQRNAMLVYTSCGWFFDEISGIEAVQVMQYASRAMQLAEELQVLSLESDYLSILGKAPSNVYENGAKTYEKFVRPARVDLLRVGAHYAISSLFEEYPMSKGIYCYNIKSQVYERMVAGKLKLAIGKADIVSNITREEETMSFAVLHLGDQNINGGARKYVGDEAFSVMQHEIKEAFEKGNIPNIIRRMDKHFGMHNYSLWHLFKDEQRKVFSKILEHTLKEIELYFRQIYEHNYSVMQAMTELHIPLPKALATTVEFITNTDIRSMLANKEPNFSLLNNLIEEVKRWSLELDKTTLSFVASQKINTLMEKLSGAPEDVYLLETLDTLIRILRSMPLELDLWKAQNLHFSIGKSHYSEMRERAEKGDQTAIKWVEHFNGLGDYLHVRRL